MTFHLDKTQKPFIAYKESLAPKTVRKDSVFDLNDKLRFQVEEALLQTITKFIEDYPMILGIEAKVSAARGSAPTNFIISAAEVKIDLSPDINNPKQIE